MSTEFSPDIIVDANGHPLGVYRDNQDPSDATRLHPVPKTNAKGEPIKDGDSNVIQMLPLNDPRVAEELAKAGLAVHEDGVHLVAIEE